MKISIPVGRRRLSPDLKRSVQVKLSLTQEEKSKVEGFAEKYGMLLSPAARFLTVSALDNLEFVEDAPE
jgi:hypothetical protein